MYLELSYVLSDNIPNYPESPKEEFKALLRQEHGDVSNTGMMFHFTHNGTHVDAPFHFDKNGKRIDELPIESFIYERPLFIDVPKRPSEVIKLDELKDYDLKQADALLIRSGFDRIRIEDPLTYRFMFPGIDLNLARFIREELVDIKAIIIDFLSVDRFFDGNRNNFPIHHQLLSSTTSRKRPVLIIEDVNLEPLIGNNVKKVFALPMRYQRADGAPVSVVAEVG